MKTGKYSLIPQCSGELKLFRSLFLFSILTCYFNLSYSQTPISGIVNTYYKVEDIIPAKACILIADPTGLGYNDKVMLVQMKGATINTSNDANFGNIASLNNVGNYEIGTVCTVIGDSVFLTFMLLNSYTVADKVQLVKIPQYISARVTSTLRAAPWNNATGTGGVLALIANDDLILDAPVSGDSSGYRGGAYRFSTGTCGNTFFPPPANGYAYNATDLDPQNGAFKGEGVAEVDIAISGGRGAPANGGGGGNNHNNGGGGGANILAGGIGGGNSSVAGCRLNRQGFAGKPLNNSGGNKIFMGGGGGAGQANNTVTVNPRGGGHGGGIVFISANNLIGNGNIISANGQSGGSTIGDGASGGGAGGTIILNINNYIGTATIGVNGGQGGAINNEFNNQRCYGGGGGGSGGAIYFSGAAPAITANVSGGLAGAETNRLNCGAPNPPSAGTNGQLASNYTYRSSLVLESSYCALLLPVDLVWFKARYTNGHVQLNWEIAHPETADRFIVERSGDGSTWTSINELRAIDDISLYRDIDLSPQSKTNYYRLKMFDKNSIVNYSAVQKIYIPSKNDLVKIYPNPAHKKIIITGKISSFTKLFLYDLSGKLLWEKKLITNHTTVEIDLPDLSRGIYILKVEDAVTKLFIR